MTHRFAEHLAAHGDDVAVLTDDRELTYRQLCDEVAGMAAEFGTRRRLVMIETRNDLATLVSYLGAMAGDHVVLPLPAGHDHSAIVDIYEPDVVVTGGVIEHRHDPPSRELHPDLALLLSTSGSTGSPKLVRLTHENLHANAAAIARYLDIERTDRAATTLPMSYCYGLSVIHSHLLTGAGLILTDDSVVDDRLLGVVPPLFRHHLRGRPTHLRSARPNRFRGHVAPQPAIRHAGGRAPRTRTGTAIRRTRSESRVATVRHVRRHGGDGPNGLSATRTRHRVPDEHRPSDPRRIVHRRAVGRGGGRHGRTGLSRSQRDDGLRPRA